ncbi:MAG: AraC family transcriptional regulator [Paenibacillus sp.]|nr:AraC family transcriptional regulator [Paenibacillus sp.]
MFTKNYSVTLNPRAESSDLNVLFAGYQRTKPTHSVGPRVHDYYLLHYVVSGAGELECAGKKHIVGQGSCFFIFPGHVVSYSANPNDPWFYRWVGFRGPLADIVTRKINVSPDNPILQALQPRRTAALMYRMQSVLHKGLRSCDFEVNGLIRILLSQWLDAPEPEKSRLSSETDRKVQQALRWLSLQYSEPISIDQLAATLGYNRTYFSKVFKQHTGWTPVGFLHRIRMEHARILLTQPLTIEQVAYSVGYTDALYFSKQFKKWSGFSPTEYRSGRF